MFKNKDQYFNKKIVNGTSVPKFNKNAVQAAIDETMVINTTTTSLPSKNKEKAKESLRNAL